LVAFGTDGVRGRAYDELTLADASRVGAAVAEVFGSASIAVGRDTRESGPDFLAALATGIGSKEARVADLGIVPTPLVAHYSASHGIPGIVVSASHNPFHDNGLKVFAPGGVKLDDETEAALEVAIASQPELSRSPAVPTDVAPAAVAEYVEHIAASVAPRDLGGLKVVVDTANGAASELAGPVLERLGAEVELIHAAPDGRNINARCGSTDPRDLIEAVRSGGADCGIALDGDADRLVAVAGDGGLVDGDHIIAICAIDRHDRQTLTDDTVVVTVMTNLGFRQAMEERRIRVFETPVGDRHVLAALETRGWSLGGEQSGHVIFRDLATTGDGLLTGVQLLDVVSRSGTSLADLSAAAMTRLPQVLHNVAVTGDATAAVARLQPQLVDLLSELGDRGRVLVRPSGTEPLIRVMVEASSEAEARDLATRVASWI
jgi:phosphoglucosamine mutase